MIIDIAFEKSSFDIILPLIAILSLIETKCGEVKVAVLKRAFFNIDANKHTVEPFPFVPETVTEK